MTALVPMRAKVYPSYLRESAAGYAEDNIASGRWPKEGALERSLAEMQSQLPQGLATPDNHLFEIVATEGRETVGYLWFAVEERHGMRRAFIYDLGVKKAFRRQGHAWRALQALEQIVASLGLSSIGLHVFSQNAGAQALYRELGFAVTGINMRKPISAEPARP